MQPCGVEGPKCTRQSNDEGLVLQEGFDQMAYNEFSEHTNEPEPDQASWLKPSGIWRGEPRDGKTGNCESLTAKHSVEEDQRKMCKETSLISIKIRKFPRRKEAKWKVFIKKFNF